MAGQHCLRRHVGFLALLFTGVTSIIGSGWLFASLYAAQLAGPAAILSWLLGGAVVLVIALMYAELGAALPVAGAIARIPCFSHGATASFVAGWLCWAAYVAMAPIEVIAVLDYASNYWPWLTTTAAGDRVLTTAGLAVAALLMLLFTAINFFGVAWLARANIVVTFWKILVPLVAAVALLAVGLRSENFTAYGGFAPQGSAGVFAAVASGGVIFSLIGFRAIVDLAGEAKRPQRTVPLAIVGTVVLCTAIYILLQVTFIGVIPPEHLAGGWGAVAENVPGGPFAAFAALLGMTWLALALYADAGISPSGTALAYLGTTARINYALARGGQIPAVFGQLNRFHVPSWSIGFNFLVGLLLFLPFPGWSEMVGFISAAGVLSFAFGPVSLAALRRQAPDLPRPFRLAAATPLAALAMVLSSAVVYWAGWATNWKLFLLLLFGLVLLAATHAWRRRPLAELHLRQALWIWPYFGGLGLISWFGNYGGGRGLLAAPLDLVLVALVALTSLVLALRLRLPAATAQALIAESAADTAAA